ncbi:MAG: hypothetical protein QM808_13460 [Steroidobacteraceae bacterium]
MKQQQLLALFAMASLAAGCSGGSDSEAPAATAAASAGSSSSSGNSSSTSNASSASSTGNTGGGSSASSSSTTSTTSNSSTSSATSSTSTSASSHPYCFTACSADGGQAGISLPDGSATQSGTAATLGSPTSTIFNGLKTVVDPFAHTPAHAVAAAAAALPSGLSGETKPYIPNVKILARGDAIILYFPAVAGAGDYRAYAVTSGVSFTTASNGNGKQPRGAVIACAGFRQHTYRSPVVSGYHTRELLQAIELPGFVNPGDYTIVVEATASPCPFVGMPAHTDAQISMPNNGTTTDAHTSNADSYKFQGIPIAKLRSFETIKSLYGNEIINGQGSPISWATRTSAAKLGDVVLPNDATIPSDPQVVARSTVAVRMPMFDESLNAPIFDVGADSIFEDFAVDAKVLPAAIGNNPDYAAYNGFRINPLFVLKNPTTNSDEWQFWGRYMQAADATPGTHNASGPNAQALLGVQAFTRHGRLYTTFGDTDQDVGGSLNFSSLRAPVVEMDSQKYIHSMFRINSDATHRRYWYWYLCGAATSAEIFDTTTNRYNLRPLVYETTFGPGGNNPSVPDGGTLFSSSTADDKIGIAKECLSFTEEARPENGLIAMNVGDVQTSAVLRAQIHPANKSHGIIALGNTSSDTLGLGLGMKSLGFRFKVDANGNRTGPMLEPFDQLAPLVHYDVFVRKDRLVVFINGRQGFCVDMSDIQLTMKYAMIGYGDLLYHSGIEWTELSDGPVNKDPQMYQAQLNTPIANTRVWDVVAHSDKIDIPSQFSSFNPALCKKPSNQTVQGYVP